MIYNLKEVRNTFFVGIGLAFLFLGGCGDGNKGKMFALLDPEETGIHFSNTLDETIDMKKKPKAEEAKASAIGPNVQILARETARRIRLRTKV